MVGFSDKKIDGFRSSFAKFLNWGRFCLFLGYAEEDEARDIISDGIN